MKRLVWIAFCLGWIGCAGNPPAPDVRLKVEEIKQHGHEVIDAIIKADIDEDGYISGNEWFLLTNEAFAFYIRLATPKD